MLTPTWPNMANFAFSRAKPRLPSNFSKTCWGNFSATSAHAAGRPEVRREGRQQTCPEVGAQGSDSDQQMCHWRYFSRGHRFGGVRGHQAGCLTKNSASCIPSRPNPSLLSGQISGRPSARRSPNDPPIDLQWRRPRADAPRGVARTYPKASSVPGTAAPERHRPSEQHRRPECLVLGHPSTPEPTSSHKCPKRSATGGPHCTGHTGHTEVQAKVRVTASLS